MDLIINMDEVMDQLPIWATTEIECDICSTSWIDVHAIFNNKLECPNCNNINDIGFIPLKEKFN
jgi:hypothetical protein